MELNDQIKKMITQSFPFAARTGAELLELERGYVKMKMPFKDNQNHVNIMYAGALFTLAELPGGAMCVSSFDLSKFYPIVKDMSIKFSRPAKTDVTVIAKMDENEIDQVMKTAEETGKADYKLVTELFDEAGTLVAATEGTYQLRRIGT